MSWALYALLAQGCQACLAGGGGERSAQLAHATVPGGACIVAVRQVASAFGVFVGHRCPVSY